MGYNLSELSDEGLEDLFGDQILRTGWHWLMTPVDRIYYKIYDNGVIWITL